MSPKDTAAESCRRSALSARRCATRTSGASARAARTNRDTRIHNAGRAGHEQTSAQDSDRGSGRVSGQAHLVGRECEPTRHHDPRDALGARRSGQRTVVRVVVQAIAARYIRRHRTRTLAFSLF